YCQEVRAAGCPLVARYESRQHQSVFVAEVRASVEPVRRGGSNGFGWWVRFGVGWWWWSGPGPGAGLAAEVVAVVRLEVMVPTAHPCDVGQAGGAAFGVGDATIGFQPPADVA